MGKYKITLLVLLIINLVGCHSLGVFEGKHVSKTWKNAVKVAVNNKEEINTFLTEKGHAGAYVLLDTNQGEIENILPGLNPSDAWIKHIAVGSGDDQSIDNVELPSATSPIGVFVFKKDLLERPYVIASTEVDNQVKKQLGLLNAIHHLNLDVVELKAFFSVLKKLQENQSASIADLDKKFKEVLKNFEFLSDEISSLRQEQSNSIAQIDSSLSEIYSKIQEVENLLNSL